MPHPVDTHVGQRIRQRRWLVGMTQQSLADKVGIKFQQIQKYETGVNRVSASRLWEISHALAVPISYFFEGYETGDAPVAAQSNDTDSVPQEFMNSKETASLVRIFFHLTEAQQRSLFDLAKVLSSNNT